MMKTWWDGTDIVPEINNEHRDLYQVMARLEMAIVGARDEHTVAYAVKELRERIAQHFRMEEHVVSTENLGFLSELQEDHGRLLGILRNLGDLPSGADHDRIRVYGEFVNSLKDHDIAVDQPIFRKKLH
jgi:hemerythrin